MNKKTKQKIMRVVAMYLAINLLAEYIAPIPALALTGGPSQPEVESFEPVSTTEMVNLFTGDFNYNIPLLTVPGPNGGYPINLAYHAGIGMEQEASWVGLGWNINPGVINRNMRGLPDDFDGDDITKTLYYRPQQTWGIDYAKFKIEPSALIGNYVTFMKHSGFDPDDYEEFGFDKSKIGTNFSYQVHYNNYRGVGFGIGMNLTNLAAKHLSSHYSSSLSLSYDTDGGLGVVPSMSYTKTAGRVSRIWSLDLGFSSRTGTWSLKMSKQKSITKNVLKRGEYTMRQASGQGYDPITSQQVGLWSYSNGRPGASITFSNNSFSPSQSHPVQGLTVKMGVTIGEPNATGWKFRKYTKRRFEMSYTKTESDLLARKYDSYGTLYEHEFNAAGDDYLLDFDRESDMPASKNSSCISPAYGTADVLFASGQGVAGAFRLHRSDIATTYDSPVDNSFPGATVQVEFGKDIISGALDIGGDYGVNYSRSYSGDWKAQKSDLFNLEFMSTLPTSLYEFAYYQSSGEMTASPPDEMFHVGGNEAVRFNLHSVTDSDFGIVTKVENQLVRNQNDATLANINANSYRSTRQKRSQLLSFRTSEQINKTAVGYGHPVLTLYGHNEFPSDDPVTAPYNYGVRPDHHLSELTVTNPDGTRYVYGLPVYNELQKEVMFSKDGIGEYNYDKTQEYSDGQDNAPGNSEGFENMYMSTEIPPYAYSYMITEIYSADYVDLTGNGPTDDDFGYWVKFNYSRSADGQYGWRVPYRDANYSKGHISNVMDDKLSYTYGEKEVYYLNSVETKTHEAHFILNDNAVAAELRADANGVTDENFQTGDATTTERLHYLKAIELISKTDPATVLKTVHFEYDFSLCGNVENNPGTTVTVGAVDVNAGGGKLTLKKVWFSHLGNDKGQLSPYIFDYEASGNYDNPDYALDQMDRWGNYMEDHTDSDIEYLNTENPYTNQSAANNHNKEFAAAWNLKKVTLPSGGEIVVEYESDDYAFVQDQTAMQMQRIVGLGQEGDINSVTSQANFANSSDNSRITDRYTLVFFELERELDIASDAVLLDSIYKYVENVDDIYFKVFMKLKHKPIGYTGDPFAVDYVEGYCRPDRTDKWYGYGQPDDGVIKWGWIKVRREERNPGNPVGQLDQPFKLAGWQYMRMERSDLFEDGNLFDEDNTVVQSLQAFVNLFNDVERLFGYFRFCNVNGYCERLFLKDEIEMNEDPKPSWIRLNSPDGKKYGGGHRVSSIKITDKWAVMSGDAAPVTAEYGTRYEYRMPDGTSSGVAEYEPLIGGEENALRKPLRYEERKFPYRNDGLYAEQPFGEGLYPAPNVGYQRVVVRSINNDIQPEDGTPHVEVNRTGTTVTQFYTARDFPVLNDYTDLQKKNFGIPIIVPFIGEISYNNKGYSQGFCLELNNMHGQIKSQAVYAANADIDNPNAQATSKVEYIYQTDPEGGPQGKPKLSSRVTVLNQDGVYEDADIGKTHEFYIDRQQHSNFSVSAGLQTNAGAVPPYVFWGNVFPYFEISRSMYRSISTMKIIQRNGVLSEVREYKDGAKSINKTLMYDAETGQPLLTQTINDYNRPVYTYNYASHWAYDGMGPAYENVGALFGGASITSGVLSIANAESYFVAGDEVEMESGGSIEIIWVSEVDAANDEVTFVDETGSLVTTGTYNLKILRSGRRNQQISTNGVIVSLSNPVTERKFPLFDAMSAYDASELSSETTLALDGFYTDCFTGAVMDINLAWNESTNTLSIFTSGSIGETPYGCEASLLVPDALAIDNIKEVFDHDFIYVAATGGVVVNEGGVMYNCTLTAPANCFHACLDNVLHAEAYRFKDEWDYNYLDFGNPSNDAKNTGGEFMADEAYPNDYRFGTKGIWRMEESWLYQVDRKQTTASASMTSTPGDGTYKHFVLHNWAASMSHAAQNPQWTLSNTVTQYDPHGYEVENVNPLGVYSSAMYGYGSSMPVAVASNTRLGEMAFEGFEDYSNVATYESDVPHGHCEFYSLNGSFPIAVNNTQSHTGTYGMAVVPSGGAAMEFTSDVSGATRMFNPIGGKKYHVSVWVNAPYGVTPSLVVKNDGTNVAIAAAATIDKSRDAIDGWRQINYDFVAPAATALRLELTSTGLGTCFFDDLRIQPYTSGMKTYVYNPLTFWLVAELDDRNFATFYNYDEQGALVQVKKETEKGIVTVSTSRANTKR